ncbi:MAG: hypothetical protein US48_C0007G0006 [Candidatus Levybacteria bacterium GW2011_GWA2_37_36]|nr:MAG: hypothetical protein US48_C0007G0006 [Candidatus Levybacteria bacterium GW2011_GWA2_37_36]KKS01668.1 MAG: hypothetical protein UU53_C0009G0007 [Candidatus Curtissbacteria bacterium GW2011_GWC2_41_21]KKU34787.1 MAG: hypothetical protein UX50_C0011G0003 [Candidatus Beckwithbacteria bacterium GW2011_GWA1_46_30]
MPEVKEEKITETRKYEPTDEEQKLLTKWKARFKRAKEFRDPYQAKWLRMYMLYRAYQNKQNYAYNTRLMPPIAFEIVQTVVSRLATAKRKTRILPREKQDVESESLQSWDDLVNYDFDIIELAKKLPHWIESSVIYGNGILKLAWKVSSVTKDGKTITTYDDPTASLVDLWDFLPAPETEDLQEACPWLIHRIVKKKEKIEKEEKNRGENKIYKNLEFCESKVVEDWKKERYEVNTKKMSQIAGSQKDQQGGEGKILPAKAEGEKQLELWECWDFEEDKLIVISNGEVVIRDDENPYLGVNTGKIFIDLPDMPLLWEFWATGHIEPVETTITEIADLRNQRMDDVVLMLDPVVKIRKDSGITKNDIIFSPGAIWELRKMDDAVIERPPEISLMGVNEDKLMRDEISRTLALGEYMQGMPQSTNEPLGKVAMLLGQSNLRLSMNAQTVAVALTQLVNILIQMNQEFVDKDKLYRIVGDKVDFKEFKEADKKVQVDAIVEVEPVIPPDQQARINQILLLYDKLIAQDKPDPKDPADIQRWLKRKRELQKLMLEELDLDSYIELLLGPDQTEASTVETPMNNPQNGPVSPVEGTQPPGPGVAGGIRELMNKIPLIGQMLGA